MPVANVSTAVLNMSSTYNPQNLGHDGQRILRLYLRLNAIDPQSFTDPKAPDTRIRAHHWYVVFTCVVIWSSMDMYSVRALHTGYFARYLRYLRHPDGKHMQHILGCEQFKEMAECMQSRNPWRLAKWRIKEKKDDGRILAPSYTPSYAPPVLGVHFDVEPLTRDRRDFHARTVRFASALYRAHGDLAKFPEVAPRVVDEERMRTQYDPLPEWL